MKVEEFNDIIKEIKDQSEVIEKKYIEKNKLLKARLREMVVSFLKVGWKG